MNNSIAAFLRHSLSFLAGLGAILAARSIIASDDADTVNRAGASLIEPLSLAGGVVAAGLARLVMGWISARSTAPGDGGGTNGLHGLAWFVAAGSLTGVLGFSLAGCGSGSGPATQQLPPIPIHATYHHGGTTVGYDSKGGLTIDQESGK